MLVSALTVAAETAPENSIALYFAERDPERGGSRMRIIITPGFVRIDEDGDNKDFLLFDRKQKTIYSVNRDSKRVLTIEPKTVRLKAPTSFKHKIVTDRAKYPAIGGRPVRYYKLLTNGMQCYELYAAEGLLPGAVAALREYRQTLAGEQAAVVPFMPTELQTPCELANNVFLPVRYLAHGFPVKFTDMTEKTTELIDYKVDFKADAALFQLPEGYNRMSIEKLRGKK